MALFNRTYSFVDGTTAYGSQVEAEIANIVTILNSLNVATTNWGQVSVSHATSVPLVADCAAGTQDIADFKNNSVIKASVSSTGVLTLVPTSNQIVLGTTRTITISAGTPASASRVVTIPDPGADANVILSKGTPTMGTALAMGTNKITGLANGTTSTDAAAFGQIKVLQTIFNSTSTNFTTTSGTYATTNLTATITPTSASSRILIISSCIVSAPAGGSYASLFRDSTDLGAASSKGFEFYGGSGRYPFPGLYVDSPASTSAIVYSVKALSTVGGQTTSVGLDSEKQTMVLMEIV